MRKPTIKDVAEAAGVSYATVSRALNGQDVVKGETRVRVMEAARQVGYRPNGLARSLVSKRSHTIALILPDISNPFFADVALAVEDAAMQLGYSTILCNTRWNIDIEKRVLAVVEEKCVDGIIIKPANYTDNAHLDEVIVPTVLLTQNRPPHFSHVDVNDEIGAFWGTEHLIRCGYKRIAYAGGEAASMSNLARRDGYKRALRQYGYELDNRLISSGKFSAKNGYQIADVLMNSERPPDGFMCGNDQIALGIWQKVSELGYRVPEDIGLCGFDNTSIASLPRAQLTTIGVPLQMLGEYAAKVLVDTIDAPSKIVQSIGVEPELVIRTTTRPVGENDG